MSLSACGAHRAFTRLYCYSQDALLRISERERERNCRQYIPSPRRTHAHRYRLHLSRTSAKKPAHAGRPVIVVMIHAQRLAVPAVRYCCGATVNCECLYPLPARSVKGVGEVASRRRRTEKERECSNNSKSIRKASSKPKNAFSLLQRTCPNSRTFTHLTNLTRQTSLTQAVSLAKVTSPVDLPCSKVLA